MGPTPLTPFASPSSFHVRVRLAEIWGSSLLGEQHFRSTFLGYELHEEKSMSLVFQSRTG